MKPITRLTTALLLSLTTTQTFASLAIRQNNNPGTLETYLNSVCLPNVAPGATLPPCISVQNIQGQCTPKDNSTSQLVAAAHCLCDPPSSFFSEWSGCQNCLFVHGGRSQADVDTFNQVVKIASSALCSGTPTAYFDALYSSAAAQVTPVVTGGTVSKDQFPSKTDISLYYTLTGSQGPGATPSGSNTTSVGNTSPSTGTTAARSAGTVSGAQTGSSATASRSAGAQPTGVVGAGLALLAAGGAVLAAL